MEKRWRNLGIIVVVVAVIAAVYYFPLPQAEPEAPPEEKTLSFEEGFDAIAAIWEREGVSKGALDLSDGGFADVLNASQADLLKEDITAFRESLSGYQETGETIALEALSGVYEDYLAILREGIVVAYERGELEVYDLEQFCQNNVQVTEVADKTLALLSKEESFSLRIEEFNSEYSEYIMLHNPFDAEATEAMKREANADKIMLEKVCGNLDELQP